ncbi:MAPEG family protein [Solimonas sp. K1W22B-7]|uniref:MAPEG family protein n=1 Tax=Solimonas sp. K1W22B-7 TaxID=2303331 RepID=UPI000E32F104|nr:MAPEG family protein [Solimonas sp. K1W22B-7]AXQ30791.1 MAPEG family protein [Solimonas sp. K1W22B-7]
MSALVALIGFTAWTLLLVFIAVNWRALEILRGVKADSWTRGAERERPSMVKRMEHAHFNCLENLPVFAAIVLAAYAMGKQPVVDTLACYVLIARLAQSLVHIMGVSHWMVMLRAAFYTAQVLMFFYMMWGLVA